MRGRLDEYFEKGDYDACADIIYADENKDHDFWDWQHYEEFDKIMEERYKADTGGGNG